MVVELILACRDGQFPGFVRVAVVYHLADLLDRESLGQSYGAADACLVRGSGSDRDVIQRHHSLLDRHQEVERKLVELRRSDFLDLIEPEFSGVCLAGFQRSALRNKLDGVLGEPPGGSLDRGGEGQDSFLDVSPRSHIRNVRGELHADRGSVGDDAPCVSFDECGEFRALPLALTEPAA